MSISVKNVLRRNNLNIMDEPKHDVVVYYEDGTRETIHGVCTVMTNHVHRENGPALIWDHGTNVWIQHGHHHRMDGPAVITHDGKQRWSIRGCEVTEKVNQWLKDNDVDTSKIFRFDALDDQTAVCFLAFMISLDGMLT